MKDSINFLLIINVECWLKRERFPLDGNEVFLEKSYEFSDGEIDISYTSDDIRLFQNTNNMYVWQLYLDLFLTEENKKISLFNNRDIIWIEGPIGCSGKSLHIKNFCIKYP